MLLPSLLLQLQLFVLLLAIVSSLRAIAVAMATVSGADTSAFALADLAVVADAVRCSVDVMMSAYIENFLSSYLLFGRKILKMFSKSHC